MGWKRSIALILVNIFLFMAFFTVLPPWQPEAQGKEPALELRDLRISQDLVTGQETTVTTAVYNNSSRDLEEIKLHFYVAEEREEEKQLNILAAGEEQSVEFSWRPEEAGEYQLKVIAIAEGDSTEAILPVTVSQAPISKGDIEITCIAMEVPSTIKAWQQVKVIALLENQRQEATGSFDIILYAGETSIATETIASLSGEEKKEIALNWQPQQEGSYTLKMALAEEDGEKIIGEKEVEVGEVGALELISTTPVNTGAIPGKTIQWDDEISLTFNQPVNFTRNIVVLNHNSATQTAPNSQGILQNIMTIDEENPCRVIIDIKPRLQQLGADINRLYAIWFHPLVSFEAVETGEQIKVFNSTADRIYFNTGPVPGEISLTLPANMLVGHEYRLRAIARDTTGELMEEGAFSFEIDDPSLAEITEDGSLLGKGVGSSILRTRYTTNGYTRNLSQTIEVREEVPMALATKWLYEIPSVYGGRNNHHIPVATSDGSVYFMIQYQGLGEEEFRLRALNPDGTIKEDFPEPITTVGPVVAELEGQELILTARDNLFLALDPHTGEVWWQQKLPADISTVATVAPDGTVIVGCNSNRRVYGLHPEIEGHRWSFDAIYDLSFTFTEAGRQSTAFTMDAEGNIYIAARHTLWVINSTTGEKKWQYAIPGGEEIRYQPGVAGDGTVFLIYGDGISRPITITALTPPEAGEEPEIKWSKTDIYVGSFSSTDINPRRVLLDDEGHLYFSYQEEYGSNNPYHHVKFDGATGEIVQHFPMGFRGGVFASNGHLYTEYAIYDTEGNTLAYYDEYYGNVSYFSYRSFSLMEDEDMIPTIYRFWRGAPGESGTSRAIAVEATRLYSKEGSEPHSIRLDKEEVILHQGESQYIYPRVLDENGIVMLTEQLDFQSSDPQLVSVEDGLLTASSSETGEAEITIQVSNHPEITTTVKVEVRTAPIPEGMYFVMTSRSISTREEAKPYVVERVSGPVDELVGSVSVFIEDQHGNLVQQQRVLWELGDSNLVSMLNYNGLSEDSTYRYNATLTGTREGSTYLKATLENYPEITATLEIDVLPTDIEVLWERPMEGPWGQQEGIHAMGMDGEIFYVNYGKLNAVDKTNGNILWSTDINHIYGMALIEPVVSTDGIIYVYGTTTTSVAAVDPADGNVLWHTYIDTDGIKELLAGTEGIYALTNSKKVQRFTKEGNPTSLVDREVSSMLLSKEDILYIATEEGIYAVGSHGEKTHLYRGEEGSGLKLLELAPNGVLILEEKIGNSHKIISLNTDGTVNWHRDTTYPTAPKGAASDEEGRLYLLYDAGENPRAHFEILEGDGTLLSKNILPHGAFSNPTKPLPAANNRVYFDANTIYTVDRDSGDIITSFRIKTTYANATASSLTLDEEGTLYGVFAARLMAISQRNYYGDEIQMGLANRQRMEAGALAELTLGINNTLQEDTEIHLKAVLTGDKGKNASSILSTSMMLSAEDRRELSLGIKVPPGDSWMLEVMAIDAVTGQSYGGFSESINR